MFFGSLLSWRTAGIVAVVVLLVLAQAGVLGDTIARWIFFCAVALVASRGIDSRKAASQARRNEKAQYLREEEQKHRDRRAAEDRAQTDGPGT